MKNFKLVFASLLFSYYGTSQTTDIQWSKEFNTSGHCSVVDMKKSSNGDIFITGIFYDTLVVPGLIPRTLISSGLSDVFLAKYLPNGDLDWVKKIGGTGTDKVSALVTSSNGNVTIAGRFQSTINIDSSTSTTLVSDGSYNSFIIKFWATGTLYFSHALKGSNFNEIKGLTTDGTFIYALGSFFGGLDLDPGGGVDSVQSNGSADVFLIKFGHSGWYHWGKSFGSSLWDNPSKILITESNNLLSAGTFQETFVVDSAVSNDSLILGGTDDVFFVEHTTTGYYRSSFSFTGSSNSTTTVEDLINVNGDIYVLGSFSDTVDFNPYTSQSRISISGRDTYITKFYYWSYPVFDWVRQIGSSSSGAESYCMDFHSGSVIVGGRFSGSIDFDPSSSTHLMTAYRQKDPFLVSFSDQGNFNWGQSFEASGTSEIKELYAFASDTIIVSGDFADTLRLEPTTGNHTLITNSAYESFLAQIKISGVLLSKDDQILTQSKLTLFPNPNLSSFMFLYNEEMMSYKIIDLKGKIIAKQELSGSGILEIGFELSKGVYFLNVQYHDNTVTVKKIVKK